jgi:hypothetical protein
MIDFFIRNKPLFPEFSSMILHEKCTKYNYSRLNFSISCISYIPESDFFAENKRYFLLINGTIYSSAAFKNPYSRLFPVDILQLLPEILKNPAMLRGNFNIILLDKNDKKLHIITDLFGLSPIYFGYSAEETFLTTNLSLLSEQFSLNIEVLFEKILFEHSLTDNTILNGVKRLDQAAILEISPNLMKSSYYFNWKDFFLSAGNKRYDNDDFLNLFNEITKARANIEKSNLITLTGGHDSRAVLSAFLKSGFNVKSFSFGLPGSPNTQIPEKVAKKLNIHHKSVYLEKDFEKHYLRNAMQTLLLSDGELSFEQQPTFYASQKMEEDNNYVYTGLLAGEILGPMRNIRNYMNINYYKAVLGDTENFRISELLMNKESFSFISDIPRHSIEEKLTQQKNELNIFDKENLTHLKYIYKLISYGFKYFYGSQIQLQRYSLINIPSFFDFDIISMLINTDFHLRYQNNFKGLYKRRNSREPQLYVINRNSRPLSQIPVDLGYPPAFYTGMINKFFIPAYYYYRQLQRKRLNHKKDFTPEIWSGNIYNPNFHERTTGSDFFNKTEIVRYLKNLQGNSAYYSFENNRIVSLYLFTHLLNKRK